MRTRRESVETLANIADHRAVERKDKDEKRQAKKKKKKCYSQFFGLKYDKIQESLQQETGFFGLKVGEYGKCRNQELNEDERKKCVERVFEGFSQCLIK